MSLGHRSASIVAVSHVDAVRRSILASLGLGLAACSADAFRREEPEIVVPPPPSAEPSPNGVATARPRPPSRGYVVEANGTVHRAGPETCDPEIRSPACRGDERSKSCERDADCTEGAHGKCITGVGQIGTFCGCVYSCAEDSECRPDSDGTPSVCVCANALPRGGSQSRCVTARCQSDDECPAGDCGVSAYDNGCGISYSLACRSASDTCAVADDCPGGTTCGADHTGRWRCLGRSCVIGRPLFVEGHARTAPSVSGPHWQVEGLQGLSFDPDPAAAEHWLEVAALEHASVGSFARFTLQLLVLGAPSELIARAQRAALDEVEHAELAYSVAAALGAGERGPGPLPLAAAAIATSLDEIVEALVVEGCVGETLGAIEALACAEAAHPAIARVLRRIADDERRHAELAWSTLAWLRGRYGERVVASARRGFDEARRALELDPAASAARPALGVLDALELRALHRQSFEGAVRPIADSLLHPGPIGLIGPGCISNDRRVHTIELQRSVDTGRCIAAQAEGRRTP